jgi:hypothetical protein
LAEAEGDELDALGILVRRLNDPTFRQVVVTELADELAARAPTATRAIDEARRFGESDFAVRQALDHHLDPRENPRRAEV